MRRAPPDHSASPPRIRAARRAPRPPRRLTYRARVLGELPEPGLAMGPLYGRFILADLSTAAAVPMSAIMWSLYGRFMLADPELFAEFLALVQ
jgi:hypothetical protein